MWICKQAISIMLNIVQVNESIQMVDATLGWLIDGLRERNISNCVNLIVTSDHGKVFMVLTCVLGQYHVTLLTS